MKPGNPEKSWTLQERLPRAFTVGDYHLLRPQVDVALPNAAGWQVLLQAFERRIKERFLDPIADLERFDDDDHLPMRPGFAILALDCLLIDTLQSFREGRVSTGEISPSRSFETFFKNAPAFDTFSGRDRNRFIHYVRHGLLHNGETRGDWKIRMSGAEVIAKEGSVRTINRRLFHAGVVNEFDSYRRSLLAADADERDRFLRRMDSGCGWPVVRDAPVRCLRFLLVT